MSQWGNLIVTEFNSAKTILLSIFVAIGLVRIVINGISYKGGTDDEKLDAKKSIRNNVIWFLGLPFALWLAMYIYGKASGIS
jgi:hypothetical protein